MFDAITGTPAAYASAPVQGDPRLVRGPPETVVLDELSEEGDGRWLVVFCDEINLPAASTPELRSARPEGDEPDVSDPDQTPGG